MNKPSTKLRIMETALDLFNQLGTPNISTNHIALELDISPGNLYYHFRNKEQLIEELFATFEAQFQPLITPTFAKQITLEDVWFFLHFNFELTAQYRFIYRDTDFIMLKCPALARKFQRILKQLNSSLLSLLNQLAAAGALTTSAKQTLEDLALNMALVCTQWVRFNQHLSGKNKADVTSEDLSRGVYQVLSLLLPYLDESYQAHLHTLRSEY